MSHVRAVRVASARMSLSGRCPLCRLGSGNGGLVCSELESVSYYFTAVQCSAVTIIYSWYPTAPRADSRAEPARPICYGLERCHDKGSRDGEGRKHERDRYLLWKRI